MDIQPRLIPVTKAPFYAGVCWHVFQDVFRPFLTVYQEGRRKLIDRQELDALIDQKMAAAQNLQRGKRDAVVSIGVKQCPEKQSQASGRGKASGTSKNRLPATADFTRALELARGKKLSKS